MSIISLCVKCAIDFIAVVVLVLAGAYFFAIIGRNSNPACSVLAIDIVYWIINEAKTIQTRTTLFSEVSSFKNFRTEIFCDLYLALTLW